MRKIDMPILLLLLALSATLLAIEPDAIRQKAVAKGLRATPSTYASLRSLVDVPENPMSLEKIVLGKKLFFDKALSKSRKIACAKCHDLQKGGEDGIPTAIGHDGLKNPRHLNTPTVLNTAFSKHLFWDGRSPTLRDQAKGPTQAPFEMASTPGLIEKRVKEDPEYASLFHAAYGDEANITFETITMAIAVYEKTLVTRSAFDAFLEGDDAALTSDAREGLELFIDLGCKGCHFGHAIGGQRIQKFPLRDYNSIIDLSSVYDEKTKRRHVSKMALNFRPYHPYPFKSTGGFMGKDGTRKFRVPILRNITQTAPYFHNGVVKDLREAIFIMGRYQIGVDLDEQQIDKIEAFFKSLEGDIVDLDLNSP